METAQSLKGRVALVTGGGSGIGRAIVEGLAAAGAAVMINYYTHAETAKALADQIKSAGGDADSIPGDISRPEDVEAMFQAVDRRWGQIDILVNNAGVEDVRRPAWELPVEEWEKVIAVNLSGSFLCSRAALSRMVPRRNGVIIAITSVHEVVPWGGHSGYNASKAGIAMLMRTLALEVAPLGVRVLCVAPGAIQTPINQEVWSNPEGLADLLSKIPVRRLGRAEDVAQVVTFLATDAASYVTGSTVFVDGGMTLYPEFAHGG